MVEFRLLSVAVGLTCSSDPCRHEGFIHAFHGRTPLVYSLPLRGVGIKLLLRNPHAFAQVPLLHRQTASRKWRNLRTGLQEEVDLSTSAGQWKTFGYTCGQFPQWRFSAEKGESSPRWTHVRFKRRPAQGGPKGVSLTRTQGETDCRLFPVHRLHKSGERLRSGKSAQVGRFIGP